VKHIGRIIVSTGRLACGRRISRVRIGRHPRRSKRPGPRRSRCGSTSHACATVGALPPVVPAHVRRRNGHGTCPTDDPHRRTPRRRVRLLDRCRAHPRVEQLGRRGQGRHGAARDGRRELHGNPQAWWSTARDALGDDQGRGTTARRVRRLVGGGRQRNLDVDTGSGRRGHRPHARGRLRVAGWLRRRNGGQAVRRARDRARHQALAREREAICEAESKVAA
jgi:hypothetical protein